MRIRDGNHQRTKKKRRHRHGVLEEQIKGSDGRCPER